MALTRWPALLDCSAACAGSAMIELRVRAFPRPAQPGVRPVGVLLGLRLVAAPIGRDHGCDPGALVRLVGQDQDSSPLQLPQDPPHPGRLQVVDLAGHRPRGPQNRPARSRDDLHIHPVQSVLAGEIRAVGFDAVGVDQRPVQDHIGQPVPRGLAQSRAQHGRAGRQQAHDLLHIPPYRCE